MILVLASVAARLLKSWPNSARHSGTTNCKIRHHCCKRIVNLCHSLGNGDTIHIPSTLFISFFTFLKVKVNSISFTCCKEEIKHLLLLPVAFKILANFLTSKLESLQRRHATHFLSLTGIQSSWKLSLLTVSSQIIWVQIMHPLLTDCCHWRSGDNDLNDFLLQKMLNTVLR